MISICSMAQKTDSIPQNRYKKTFPGMVLGANKVGFWTGETGFFLGLTNNKMKQTKILSMFLHGPSLRCELGKQNDTLLIAPKFSYDYFTTYLGARISLVDYIRSNKHNLYISPEAGVSLGSFLSVYAGVNFPISSNELIEIKTFRLSITTNLLFFYFGKDKSGKTN